MFFRLPIFACALVGALSASAMAVPATPREVQWTDLAPPPVENPFDRLTQEQLAELAMVARVRQLVASKKVDADGPTAREAGVIEQRLRQAGIEVNYFLSLRDQVRRLRQRQDQWAAAELRDKHVRLAGYLVPLTMEGPLVREFLLVPDVDACGGTKLPAANQAVYVRLNDARQIRGRTPAVRVTGRLRLESTKCVLTRKLGVATFSVAYAIEPQQVEVHAAGTSSRSDPGASRAPLPTGVLRRVAFGSCAKQWQHQAIWEDVIESKPDLFLFLGDAIYADTDGRSAWAVSEAQLQGEWNRLGDKPEFQRLRAAVPLLATWDNHDYGTHDGGAAFPLREASKRIFLNFFGEPLNSPRRLRQGIYEAKVFGPPGRRVQIVLLDTRTFRSPLKSDTRSREQRKELGRVGRYVPQQDKASTLLGQAQWDWLGRQFNVPAEVRLVCSSTQIIPDQKGMDEWGLFPHERQRLFELIDRSAASGVILLSGNVHFAEVSQLDAPAYRLVELTSSGLTHVNQTYADAGNRFRAAGPFAELNFGLVEIDWDARPSAAIRLRAIGRGGNEAFVHRVALDALRK